jgi:hypothetical protein
MVEHTYNPRTQEAEKEGLWGFFCWWCSIFFFFGGTRVWTQGLLLEPLHQPFFCDGFFGDRGLRTICLGWLRTLTLLISASRVARITGMSHWCPAGLWVWGQPGLCIETLLQKKVDWSLVQWHTPKFGRLRWRAHLSPRVEGKPEQHRETPSQKRVVSINIVHSFPWNPFIQIQPQFQGLEAQQ